MGEEQAFNRKRIDRDKEKKEGDLEEEFAFALYDDGNVRNRQNLIVRRIDQSNLSEAEKEALLKYHEINLADIDAIMDDEKRAHEAELERALKERVDKRRKMLERKYRREI